MEKNDILKKCREFNNSNDYLYYVIHKEPSDTTAIICAPCNYLYANDADQFFGICIYVSENALPDELQSAFPSRKRLLGLPMAKISEKTGPEGTSYLLSPQIQELPLRCRLDAAPKGSSGFSPAYTCYSCEDVVDIISPRKALLDRCRENADLRAFLSSLAGRFGLETEQMGLIGSAALGSDHPVDYDIVFYGDASELLRIKGIIDEINHEQGTPIVGGLPLPFRFRHEGCKVDTIFVYEPSMLSGIHSARPVRTGVPFRCRVTDDTWALQVEPYMKVDGEDFSSLLIVETFFHCVFRKGDIIEGRGDILLWNHDGTDEAIMVCRDPFSQLIDFTKYFTRFA